MTQTPSKTILVVDDEPDVEVIIRHRFRQQIRDGEWSFVFAGNGREALDIVQSSPDLDLVVTDINMPVMDGLALLRELSAAGSEVKSIVISAYDDMSNIRQAMNQGAFDFVTKPLDLGDLESTIKKNLSVVSQLKEMRKLQRHKLELESASRAKTRFVADLSHELRTPLNAIVLYSELVMEVAEDMGAAQLIPDLKKILTAGQHLATLVDGILDFSKVEAGKIQLHFETFRVEDVVRSACDVVRPAFDKNHNELKVDVSDNCGVMYSDIMRVRQSLFNLLSNAAKFTERGTVELCVRRDEPDMIFSVRDSGIGMTAEQVQNLFQPFTQADSSTTRKYGGTGLGLALTQRFCELLGGSIKVESEAGKGTTFTMRLPAVTTVTTAVTTEPVPSADGV
jgi:signal transduction histidine kinase